MRVNESMDAIKFNQSEEYIASGKSEKKSINGSSVYAGNLNLCDPVAERRKKAQEKAMKVVSDAWESDKAIDEMIQERKDHYRQMKELEKEYTDEIQRIHQEKADLKTTYGIADDSEEQKDLELLEKRQAYKNGDFSAKLSTEELEQLREIDAQPRTEYQERVLELNERAHVRQEKLEDVRKYMADDMADVRSIQLERLKSHGMVDAKKSAESIMEVASVEIKGMLIEEAKENLDEKQEEDEKKAEEATEEKEVKEEQQEELKEKMLIQEALLAKTKEAVEKAKAQQEQNQAPKLEMDELLDMVQPAGQSVEVSKNLTEIKNSMKLLAADLEGIQVDQTV